jgi:glycosyltransferase involved in cell wall biosynthesis
VNKDKVTGYNVPVGNSGEMASAIRKLLGDSDQYNIMSGNCLSRFKEVFRKEIMISAIENLYRRIMEENNNTRSGDVQ